MPFRLRPAKPTDADVIARVFSASLRLLTFLPPLHTVEEDRSFIRNRILQECSVTVAEDDGAIRAFLARENEEIRLLHSHPDHVGRGAGSLLIAAAKATSHSLWLLVLSGKRRGPPLLRKARFPGRGFHGRRTQRGEDARYALSLVTPVTSHLLPGTAPLALHFTSSSFLFFYAAALRSTRGIGHRGQCPSRG
jgi:hypothetical protein